MKLPLLLVMVGSAIANSVAQDMSRLYTHVDQEFGHIPQLFVLHRGHHYQDSDWYHDICGHNLPEIQYDDVTIDRWLKSYSLKWKCNKPGKSYLVDGTALKQTIDSTND